MDATDRVMRAYLKTHRLTNVQAVAVRAEVSRFIKELATGKAEEVGPPAGSSQAADDK